VSPAIRRIRTVAMAAVVGVAAAACTGGASITLTATFDDIGDMVTQHAVQMADVRIGRITKIELTDDFKAKVTFTIRDDVDIPTNTTAFVAKTSLLGEKFIDLRPNGPVGEGPFLADGDDLGPGVETAELEFVAEQAVSLLGAVIDDDVAQLVNAGAAAFGGRGDDLRSIIADLATVSSTLAERSGRIATVIDQLDDAIGTLAGGSGDIDSLLVNLADTTVVLADNRDRAISALDQLSRLAAVQNDLLDVYRVDMSRQIGQVDAILAEVAGAHGDVDALLTWLARFTTRVPLAIPGDFTQVYAQVNS